LSALKGKTVFITGASRGIGRAIALACASRGANVVIAAKTAEPHAKLPGTIHTVADEVKALGGNPLPIQLDVRDETGIRNAMDHTAGVFGGIDALINNAGAIRLTPVEKTPARVWDLMHQVNVRAANFCSRAAIPWLRKSEMGQIISMSPPVSMRPEWLASQTPYTLSKYGMSLLTIGLAAELRNDGIRVNSLWPRIIIATAAIRFAVGDEEMMRRARTPEIMADATLALLAADSAVIAGKAFLDEEALALANVQNLAPYNCVEGGTPFRPEKALPAITL